MATSNRIPTTAQKAAPQLPQGIDLRAYLELKHGIHRYLANKIDLTNMPEVPDERQR